MSTDRRLEALARRLRDARHVAVLTGAGISAESGIPTFRDAQSGLWARYRAEDLATPEAFRRDPELVWRWYLWRRDLCRAAQPNAGHLALVELARQVPRLTLVTQNVDGLHRRAGSRNVLELHGCLLEARRLDDGAVVPLPETPATLPPRCPRSGALLRPNVVWFGEALPAHILAAAGQAARDCDVMLVVGTSALVAPASALPFAALEADAFVVEVNPCETPLSASASLHLQGPASEILPRLLPGAWPCETREPG